MRRSIVAGVAVTSAAAFALIAPGQATAATTTATFTIAAGSLSITAPAAAGLAVDTDGTLASGTIPDIKVIDDRRGTAGWIASVSGTNFGYRSTAGVILSQTGRPTYAPGDANVTGTAIVTPSPEGTVPPDNTPMTVQTATGVSGVNTSTWSATVAVDLPKSLLAGQYQGTFTHSVA